MSPSGEGTTILEDALAVVTEYEEKFKELHEKLQNALDAVKMTDESKGEEIRKLRESNAAMSSKLKDIEDQMSRLSKTYQELAGKQVEAVDVRELLAIYVTLLEQVFEGRPHAKILWLLHGQKQKMTRAEINKSSGVQPAIVLKSIYDLASANLIHYDEDSQELSIKRRLY
jgi:predicted RNase H-like nuclease (RuvC/YqgF family)